MCCCIEALNLIHVVSGVGPKSSLCPAGPDFCSGLCHYVLWGHSAVYFLIGSVVFLHLLCLAKGKMFCALCFCVCAKETCLRALHQLSWMVIINKHKLFEWLRFCRLPQRGTGQLPLQLQRVKVSKTLPRQLATLANLKFERGNG